MSKFKLSTLIGAIYLIGTFFYGIVGFSQSSQPLVRLTTNPPVSQILPFEAEATTPLSPVQMTLQAVDRGGQPLENAKISLKILTPAKNPWFTTDFPIVEGTTLLEMEAIAPKGELQIQQMLPIRGTYKLLVNVTPVLENTFTPIEQTLTLPVPESWLKYRNFAILAMILLIMGLVGGWVIGGQQPLEAGEIVPQRVRLLLSGVIVIAIAALLFVNISAEIAQSEMSMPMSHMTQPVSLANNSGIVQSQGLQAQLLGDVQATVGKPASLKVKVIDTQTNQPATDVIMHVKTTQLENNWLAFATSGIADTRGQLAWQQQFFDGAPHKIEVEIAPQANAVRQFQPFQVEREIEVEGVAPPLTVRLLVLAYLTAIVAVGLAIALILRRKVKISRSHS